MPALQPSTYPQGFLNGVTLREVPIVQTNPGKVWWVYNGAVTQVGQVGGSDGNPGTFNKPFSTLAGALANCVAARGDIIMVRAGHAEAISSATALNINKSGVAIIGTGGGSLRPTFTLNTANTSTITVSANNVSIQNILLVGNFLSIASCITVTTATDLLIDNCEFRDTSSILGFLNIVTTSAVDNAADGFTFTNNAVWGLSTSATSPIILGGNADRVGISGNQVALAVQNGNAALLAKTTKVCRRLLVDSNRVFRLNTNTTGGGLISTTSTTDTGQVINNYLTSATASGAILIPTGTGLGFTNNLFCGDADASGFVLPAIGVN